MIRSTVRARCFQQSMMLPTAYGERNLFLLTKILFHFNFACHFIYDLFFLFLLSGRQNAKDALKMKYIKLYENMSIDDPFEDDMTPMKRDDVYVELATVKANDMDKHFNLNNDMKFHRQLEHFKHTSILKEKIFKDKDPSLVVRGIAGVGKTTLVNTYTYDWAKKSLLNGNDSEVPKIDFLFKLSCRDLNIQYTNNKEIFNSDENLLQSNFPHVFSQISMDDLRMNPSSVLILIDGLDELKYKFDCEENNLLIQRIRSLINIKTMGFRTMVISRPEAAQKAYNFLKEEYKELNRTPSMIEVCGFSPESKVEYIRKRIDNPSLRESLIDIIRKDDNLRMMARIPFYLWVMCEISRNSSVSGIKTTTELCTYAVIAFINHCLRIKNKDETILENSDGFNLKPEDMPKIYSHIVSLSMLSKQTYEMSKVVFEKSDLKNVRLMSKVDVEMTGFIVESKGKFQFRHLVLQEYFTALYIFLSGKYYLLKRDEFKNCLHLVTGLKYLEKNANEKITKFLQSIKDQYFASYIRRFVWFWDQYFRSNSGVEAILENSLIEELLKINKSGPAEIVIDKEKSILLDATNECFNEFSPGLKERFSGKNVQVENIFFQHDITHAVNFLEAMNINSISKLFINSFSNNQLPPNIHNLFKLYYDGISDRSKQICELGSGDGMGIESSMDYSPDQERYLTAIMPERKENNESRHTDVIDHLIGMVGILKVNDTYDSHNQLLEQIANKCRNNSVPLKDQQLILRYSEERLSDRFQELERFIAGSDIPYLNVKRSKLDVDLLGHLKDAVDSRFRHGTLQALQSLCLDECRIGKFKSDDEERLLDVLVSIICLTKEVSLEANELESSFVMKLVEKINEQPADQYILQKLFILRQDPKNQASIGDKRIRLEKGKIF